MWNFSHYYTFLHNIKSSFGFFRFVWIFKLHEFHFDCPWSNTDSDASEWIFFHMGTWSQTAQWFNCYFMFDFRFFTIAAIVILKIMCKLYCPEISDVHKYGQQSRHFFLPTDTKCAFSRTNNNQPIIIETLSRLAKK